MLKRWLTMGLPTVPVYRMAALMLALVALEMLGGMVWQELTQFRIATAFGGWPPSTALFFLLPSASVFGFSLLMLRRGLRSGSGKHFEREPVALWFVPAGLLAGIAGSLHLMGMDGLTLWRIPALVRLALFVWIVLLALQLERIASGSRRWGFSVSGFDFRDLFNILVLGFLFFGAAHLVVAYDPLAPGQHALPEWFLPLFAIFAAVLLSSLSAAVLRFPLGAAIAGFLMLGVRNALWTGLSASLPGSSVIPVMLGPVFVLDIWQWTKAGQASARSLAGIACVALFLNYPIFDEWLGMTFSGLHYAGLLGVAFFVALASAHLAQFIGQALETLGAWYDQDRRQPVSCWTTGLLGLVALHSLALFLILPR